MSFIPIDHLIIKGWLGANYIKVNNIECKIIVNTTHLLVVERFYFYTTSFKSELNKNLTYGGIEINFAANCPRIVFLIHSTDFRISLQFTQFTNGVITP